MRLLVASLLASVFACCSFAATSAQTCLANHGWWNRSSNFAQAREERLPDAPVNYVDPGQNGSIRVHASDQPGVMVKACIQASAPSDVEARELASRVRITNGAGHIEASGPNEGESGRNWSVSYEIWMPTDSAVKLDASNGSIEVDGVQGRIRFHTLNGSVRLSNVSGEVAGETTNGSLTVSVTNRNHTPGGLRLETTNGSVNIELPQELSARVQVSTVNGTIRTDFPITVQGEIGKQVSFTLGSGGPEIDAKTVNGSIHITRRA